MDEEIVKCQICRGQIFDGMTVVDITPGEFIAGDGNQIETGVEYKDWNDRKFAHGSCYDWATGPRFIK